MALYLHTPIGLKPCVGKIFPFIHHNANQRYPYYGVVVRLAWSKYPESYAGDSGATGRAPMPGR